MARCLPYTCTMARYLALFLSERLGCSLPGRLHLYFSPCSPPPRSAFAPSACLSICVFSRVWVQFGWVTVAALGVWSARSAVHHHGTTLVGSHSRTRPKRGSKDECLPITGQLSLYVCVRLALDCRWTNPTHPSSAYTHLGRDCLFMWQRSRQFSCFYSLLVAGLCLVHNHCAAV